MRVPPGLVAANEQHVPAQELAERRRERTVDDMTDPGPAVDRRLDRVGEAHVVLDDPAVGEREPQDRGVGIGPGRDLDHRPGDQLIDDAVPFASATKNRRSSRTPFASTRISSRDSSPRLRTGAMLRRLTRGMTAMLPAHIRKTPNRVSGIGAWSDASMPIARTRRVSSGSMTPSSQSRAVAKYGEPSRS